MKSKCRTCCQDCVHYDSFFGSCNIYYEQKGATMQRKTYTLSEKAVKILEDLAKKTKLKMSTIVEAGILEMEKIYNEKNSINF